MFVPPASPRPRLLFVDTFARRLQNMVVMPPPTVREAVLGLKMTDRLAGP